MSNCDKVPFPAAWLGAERESINPAASLLVALFPAEKLRSAEGSHPFPLIDLDPVHGELFTSTPGEKPSDQHPGGLGTGCSRRGASMILNISIYLLAFI